MTDKPQGVGPDDFGGSDYPLDESSLDFGTPPPFVPCPHARVTCDKPGGIYTCGDCGFKAYGSPRPDNWHMPDPVPLSWTPFLSMHFPTDDERQAYELLVEGAIERFKDNGIKPDQNPFAEFACESLNPVLVRQFVDVTGRAPRDDAEFERFCSPKECITTETCDECGADLSPLVETITWIPVAERLPELVPSKGRWPCMPVLFVSDEVVHKGEVSSAENGRIYWDDDDPDVSIRFDSVTHWAELPKGPKT